MSNPPLPIDGERVQHISAFADGDVGGNPAGVYVSSNMPGSSIRVSGRARTMTTAYDRVDGQ